MNSLDEKKPLVFKCQLCTFLINCVILYITFSQNKGVWSWEKVKVMFSNVQITKHAECLHMKDDRERGGKDGSQA